MNLQDRRKYSRTPRERRQAWKEGRLGDNPNPIVPDAEKSGKLSNKGQETPKKEATLIMDGLSKASRKPLQPVFQLLDSPLICELNTHTTFHHMECKLELYVPDCTTVCATAL